MKTKRMDRATFNILLDELDGNSLETLKNKQATYSADDDTLHNFRAGAEILGGTPAQACWGYMTKHLTALRDKVERNDFSDRADLLEKCQDTINYIRFLWLIGNDEEHQRKENLPMYRRNEQGATFEYEGREVFVEDFETSRRVAEVVAELMDAGRNYD